MGDARLALHHQSFLDATKSYIFSDINFMTYLSSRVV